MIKKRKLVCETKQSFSSLENVQYFIKYINKEGCLDYYKCNVCDDFHTTSVVSKKTIHQKREHTRQKRERVTIKKMKK